ncbi:hypothetical protein HOD96_03880 [Candidatus Falkowbacteria bacterium]|jgi:transcriptional regulator of heat shock response|nr:hypothetical protein [Candidatus Falkowbacteria bacterium]MBT4432881.1 hypothetical protein [Candidatus Falkowbacteria bacterium]
MKDRTQKLLDYTIRNYIKTAQPVGSSFLVEKTGLDVSSATVRNELMELEQENYLYQPHTSAGRIPTEQGYKFWLETFYKNKPLSKNKQKTLDNIKDKFKKDKEQMAKELAKTISEMSGTAIIVGFSEVNIYYTGISNLFSQPEFREYQLVCSISEIVDGLEEVLPDLFKSIKNDINILIGSDNPFSEKCSIITTKLGTNGLFIVLGPIRMNYEENIALVKFLKEII